MLKKPDCVDFAGYTESWRVLWFWVEFLIDETLVAFPC